MHLKKFIMFGLIAAVLPAVAEEAADRKTATSLTYVTHELDTRQNKFSADNNKAMEYTNSAGVVQKRAVTSDLDNGGTESLPMVGGVNTKLNQKQDDIDPVNDHTAVTYTGTAGQIGQKGIYQTTGTYADQSDNLIDAKTFNAALKNGLDSEFVCSEFKPDTNLCWVYSIHNVITDNGVLPNDYTPLEWIESSGTQYIDTGIVFDTLNTRVEIGADITSGAKNLFGFNKGTNDSLWYNVYNTNSWVYMGTSAQVCALGAGTFGIKRDIVLATDTNHNLQASVNGTELCNGTFNGTFITANQPSFTIFTVNGANLTLSRITSSRVWYTRLYKDGVLVFNGVPAQHGATVGMYDTVSRRFFTNANNNDNFIAGPVASTNIYIPQDQQ